MSISTVTSEALQLKLRQLLPSQQGFGTDLSASDTIIPIIDLTAAAEGSEVRESLQTALAFGNQTTFDVTSTTSTLVTTAGFWRITGTVNLSCTGAATNNGQISLGDGTTDKIIFKFAKIITTAFNSIENMQFDYTVFLRSGDNIKVAAGASTNMVGSYRQVADSNGVLINPVGFLPS